MVTSIQKASSSFMKSSSIPVTKFMLWQYPTLA
jgi:hypothetical protein